MRIRAPIALLAILALGGCAQRELWPEERLDPNTAVNVTIMAEPWICSDARCQLARLPQCGSR
jgi:hypothetical protein